jgi:hypothetical protein
MDKKIYFNCFKFVTAHSYFSNFQLKWIKISNLLTLDSDMPDCKIYVQTDHFYNSGIGKPVLLQASTELKNIDKDRQIVPY